jgi:hypothetical protein
VAADFLTLHLFRRDRIESRRPALSDSRSEHQHIQPIGPLESGFFPETLAVRVVVPYKNSDCIESNLGEEKLLASFEESGTNPSASPFWVNGQMVDIAEPPIAAAQRRPDHVTIRDRDVTLAKGICAKPIQGRGIVFGFYPHAASPP